MTVVLHTNQVDQEFESPLSLESRAVQSFFPKYFLDDIASSVQQRPLDSEITIIFQSMHDPANVCLDPCDLFFIQDLAKRHFVWIEILPPNIQQVPHLLTAIQQELRAAGRTGKIAAIIFSGHGNGDCFILKDPLKRDSLLTDEDVQYGIFYNVPPSTTLIFHACDTGQILAPAIAKCGYRVIACTQAVRSHETWLQFSANRISMVSEIDGIFSTESAAAIDPEYNVRKFTYLKHLVDGQFLERKESIKTLNCLIECYKRGVGVPPSFDTSVQYVKMGAKIGDPKHQFALAAFYFEGSGVKKNIVKSFYWIRQAASQQHPRALWKLGWYYENGIVVAPSPIHAIACYQKAADQGLAIARQDLLRLQSPQWTPARRRHFGRKSSTAQKK